jgi:hypothetical protein
MAKTRAWRGASVAVACVLQAATASAAYVNSLTGPVTASEIQATASWYKANPYTPNGTNQGNNLAYGNGAKQAGEMRSLYDLTGDVYFLDQAIRFSDHILSVRNNTTNGRVLWTGRREPAWPNKAADAGDAQYSGTENGLVISNMVATSKLILQNPGLWSRTVGVGDPHGYGATYLARARKYIVEGNRTNDEFVTRWFVQSDNTLHLPTHPGWAAMPGNYAKDQGNGVPWNQQDMITAGLSVIADCLMILGEDAPRVSRNDTITRAAIDWFRRDLEANKYTKNGMTVYLWGYPPGGAQRYPEDLAHASADINMLNSAYKRGRFGIPRSVMVPMADTFLQVIKLPDGTFAGKVNGGGTPRASVSASWTNYEEYRSGIYASLFKQAQLDAARNNAQGALGILSIRKRLYGGGTPAPTPTPTAPPAATPTPTPTPAPSGGVVLFGSCSYGGWSASFPPGNYRISGIVARGGANDAVSSLRVPSGFTVTLYADDNFGGPSHVVTGDDSCLTGDGFNDVVSSLRVVQN